MDVSQVWRLNHSSQDLLWLKLVPKLDLEDQLLERTPLHLWLWELRQAILIELLGAKLEHESIGNSTSSAGPLF